MTYRELLLQAELKLDINDITLGEFEQMIAPLNREIDVLDKIRAEIWDLQYGDEEKSMTDEDRADAYNNAIRQVIEIIDKHKAERSEE